VGLPGDGGASNHIHLHVRGLFGSHLFGLSILVRRTKHKESRERERERERESEREEEEKREKKRKRERGRREKREEYRAGKGDENKLEVACYLLGGSR